MKVFLKTFFLCVLLVCLGTLTVLAADAATVEVGTQAAFGEALTNANAKTETSEPTVIKLTANINMADNTSYSISGKHVVIDGQGKYAITRAVYNQVITGSARYLFVAGSGADVTFQNITVNNHVFTLYLATNGGANVTLGENTHFVATLPSGFVDTEAALGTVPYLLENRIGNTITISETAKVEYTASSAASDIIMIRNYGTLHIRGKLIDNTTSDTKDHRLIHCPNDTNTTGYIYIYETAEMTINSNGGDLDSTLMRLNGVECKIYGGKFSAPNWGKTTATNLPASLISVGSIEMTISGGTFTQDADAPMFLFFKGRGSGSLSVTGGEFTHNGIGNTFDVPVVTTVTLSGGTFTHNHTDYGHGTAVKGRTFFITADANVTIGGTATVTNKAGSAVYTSACSPTVTINGNAKVFSNSRNSYTLSFHAGKPVLNVGDSAYIRAGIYNKDGTPAYEVDDTTNRNAYAIRFANTESDSVAYDTTGFLTLNVTGNPTVEATYTCYFVSTASTDANAYNVLNVEGGTFIAHRGSGFNLKDGAKASVTNFKNAKFQTVAAAFRVENVTFKQTELTFTGCDFITTSTSETAVAVQLGLSGDVLEFTSLTFTNCSLVAAGSAIEIGNKAVIGNVYIKTTDGGNYQYKGALSSLNTSATTVFTFTLGGTGTVTMNGVSATNTSTTPLITVSGKGTLNVVDCTLAQSGAAHAILVSADANINIGGTTNITVTGASGSVLYAAASPTVHIYGTPVLTAAYWALNFAGGKPVVTVDGGTVVGTFGLVYNNRTSYNPTADGFMTATVKGGTLQATGGTTVYIRSTNTVENMLTVTGGTFKNSTSGNAYIIGTYDTTRVTMNISGGKFTDTNVLNVMMLNNSSNVLLNITGGTFTLANNRGVFNVIADAIIREGSVMKNATVNLSDAANLLRAAGTTSVTLELDNVTVKATGNAALASALVTANVKLTLKNVSVTVATENAIDILEDATATLDFQSGSITATSGAVLNVNTTGKVAVTVREGAKLTAEAGVGISATAASGSTLTVTGGIVQSKGGAAMTLGAGVTANIYDGYIGAAAGHCVSLAGGAKGTVFGGTFLFTGTEGAFMTVGDSAAATNGTLTVNGGAFRAPNAYIPVFQNNTTASVITLNSCVAMSMGNLFTNINGATVSLNHGANGYSAHNALDMKTGATLRLVSNSSGLRFVTNVSKEAYDHYVAMADGGKVTFGTLIMPAQYMTWLSTYAKQYTKEALDTLGLQYLNIESTSQGFRQNADGSYTMSAAIAGIKEENIELSFAALSYVTYTVNGVTVTQYSNYNGVKNARSAYQVARAAANDVSTTEQGDYVYEITSNGNAAYVGKFSPYSVEQWNVIGRYWTWSNATKDEVKTMDIYAIAGQSNAAGYSTITDAFRTTHGSKTFPYIYYSGGMPGTAAVNGVTKITEKNMYKPGKTVGCIGLGNNTGNLGAEFGMMEMLSQYYNATTGAYAGVVKYAVGGTSLLDVLDIKQNQYAGNWCSPSYLEGKTPAGTLSGGMFRGFVAEMENAVEDYRAMGYVVTIKGVFWMQGEAERARDNITTTYPLLFKALVEDMRAAFREMTPHSTDTVEVMVGEISKKCGGSENDTNNAFIAMQNGLDDMEGLPGIYIINSSKYTTFRNSTDNYHWIVNDMYTIGRMVGYQMVTKSLGKTSVAV